MGFAFTVHVDTRRISARDAGVRRLQRLTAGVVAAAGALALGLAFVASKAFPGRSAHAGPRMVRTTVTPRHASQTAPPLVQVGSQSQPRPQSAPAPSAPAPTPAPPVVVSGGS
jgi:hypothetical protein